MRCVHLSYLDHEAHTESAWTEVRGALDGKKVLPALGYIVAEDDEFLCVTVSRDEDEAMTPFKIVKSAIVSRIDFDEARLLALVDDGTREQIAAAGALR